METAPKFTAHLLAWSEDEAIRNARQMEGLVEHPGWPVLCEAVELYERNWMSALVNMVPPDNVAEYAKYLGRLQGIREALASAESVIEHGRALAAEARAETAPA